MFQEIFHFFITDVSGYKSVMAKINVSLKARLLQLFISSLGYKTKNE